MTATARYQSGWCGTGQHGRCTGSYSGAACTCPCNHQPALSLVPTTAAETHPEGEAGTVSAADLHARIALARSVISHRLDMADPNVRLLDSVLQGHPLAELVAGELR